MKYHAFFIFLSILAACKKQLPVQAMEASSPITHGLPADVKKIHGLLSVSSYSANAYVYTYDLYAIFADPGRDLLSAYNPCTGPFFDNNTRGNVNVGNLYYNDYTVLFPAVNGGSVFYNKIFTVSEEYDTVRWKVPGNGSFAKINETVFQPYATFIDFPVSKRKISLSNSYTFYTDSIFKDFDIITIFIDDGYNPYAGKRKVSNGGPVVFGPEDFHSINASNNIYFRITFGASRFYYKTIQGKTFVFQSTLKKIFNATILP